MGKKLKILYGFLIMSILFMTTEVMAFTTTLNGSKSIDANSTFVVAMNLSEAEDLVSLDAVITYDKDKLELTNTKGLNEWSVSVEDKIAAVNESGLTGSGGIIELTFKAKTSFLPGESTTISITNINGSNSNVQKQTGNDASHTVKINIPKSTNNNLKNITVDGTSISEFSPSITTYDLGETEAESINISAAVEDSKAIVSGTGNKKLTYGENIFQLEVTAENNSKKTYTITINKLDKRNKDNSLSSLTVSGLDIKFNKDTSSYAIKVEHNINEITINAKTSDSKATVVGIGKKTIKDYLNSFDITVTAENGDKKTYIIKIIRKDAEGNFGNLSKDNTLKSLIVEEYDINFKKETLEYNIEVENIVDSIKVEATTNDKKATYEITGNDKLSVGPNTVEIKVTAENGDEKIYKINVNRKSDSPTVTLKELIDVLEKSTSNEIIVDIKDENTILDTKIMKAIKKNKKKVIINHYKENLISYTWIIDGKNIEDTNPLETLIKLESENLEDITNLTNQTDAIYLNFEHEGNLPTNTKIKVYVGDRFENYQMVNIYHYNEANNSMDSVKNGIEVLDGYVELELTHCSEYIITKEIFESTKEPFNWITIVIIIGVLAVIGLIIFIIISKKRKPKSKLIQPQQSEIQQLGPIPTIQPQNNQYFN